MPAMTVNDVSLTAIWGARSGLAVSSATAAAGFVLPERVQIAVFGYANMGILQCRGLLTIYAVIRCGERVNRPQIVRTSFSGNHR